MVSGRPLAASLAGAGRPPGRKWVLPHCFRDQEGNDKIAELRRLLDEGWTQDQVAEKLGVLQSFVSKNCGSFPAVFDVNYHSININYTKVIGKVQQLTFTPPVDNDIVFFLENFDQDDKRDTRILIYGTLLGTGAALLADAIATFVGRLAGRQRE